MARSQEPVVLELASLPREQVGPFLILGLDKTATQKEVEKHWADRLRWARRQLIKTPLEDINWAREVLNDEERRIRADACSFNTDTTEGLLAQLAAKHGIEAGQAELGWQPLDREKPLADYNPPAEVPNRKELEATLECPVIPRELPAVFSLLEGWAQQPLDPWGIPETDRLSPSRIDPHE
jgi:hypothetical protein